jgi:hypothetical protein
MSDLEPIHTSSISRHVARQQPMVATQPQLPQIAAFKPENIQMAELLAKSGMLGKNYNNNPGACLLLIDWAQRHDVALFEVPGAVSFRDGRSTVSGRMQKKLAARRGFRSVKVHGDEQSCTVKIIDPDGVEVNGEGNGRFTYTIELARQLGLVAQNDNYKKDPAQMLYWRALTRALDQFGPDELAGVFVDEYPEFDPVEMAAANAVARGDWPPATPDGEAFLDSPTELAGKMLPPRAAGDVVEVRAASAGQVAMLVDPDEMAGALRAAATAANQKEAALVKWARSNGHDSVTSFDSLAGNTDAANDVLGWLESL